MGAAGALSLKRRQIVAGLGAGTVVGEWPGIMLKQTCRVLYSGLYLLMVCMACNWRQGTPSGNVAPALHSRRLARLGGSTQAGRRQQDGSGAVGEGGRASRAQCRPNGRHQAPALLNAGADGAGVSAQR